MMVLGGLMEQERWWLEKQGLVGRKLSVAGKGSCTQPATIPDPCRLPAARILLSNILGVKLVAPLWRMSRETPMTWAPANSQPACMQELGALSLRSLAHGASVLPDEKWQHSASPKAFPTSRQSDEAKGQETACLLYRQGNRGQRGIAWAPGFPLSNPCPPPSHLSNHDLQRMLLL